ncbi:hypothetical protein [Actinophytocola sp.]|uniref:hypothetical protein n=1 Tax=Actinophytocola sp. TaxID=1872138 RepID=UPI002D50B97F|nr:hypothetical protein [Actinophytocola sp.]HYQ62513.1 hypothetical protein [Actinophytocola sp.]
MTTDRHHTIPTGLGFGVLLSTLLAAAPAQSTVAPPAPQLSIAVDNGQTTTSAGATLTYTITVHNLGATDVPGLMISQTVPKGLKPESSATATTTESGDLNWDLDLKASGVATFHSTMTVVDTPPELLRLATVACASSSDGGPPIVCATHSDQLPAGAAAARATAGQADPSSGHGWWWYLAGAIVLVVLAVAVFLVLRRRATRKTAA